jgi:hypothetical protein
VKTEGRGRGEIVRWTGETAYCVAWGEGRAPFGLGRDRGKIGYCVVWDDRPFGTMTINGKTAKPNVLTSMINRPSMDILQAQAKNAL